MLEEAIIEHGSPTLAGLKAGCLFNFPMMGAELDEEVRRLNGVFGKKGCGIALMRCRMGRSLLFLYRNSDLSEMLNQAETAEFLRRAGYRDLTVSSAIATLKEKLSREGCFPHEVGLFLGYPLADVEGFIQNRGAGCRMCGCWKVYSNECEARRRFRKFEKCKEIYSWMYRTGMSIEKLTVSA